MKRKILFIITGILILGILFYYLGWSLAPGSYARVERYELNISEKTLIEIINELKTENNELDAKSYFGDSKNNYWYSFYFQYQDKNQIIHTWTRPKSKTITTFAFVGYKSKNNLGNWISANKYFWWWKNSKAKKEFETRILKKIKSKIKKRKSNFVDN